MIYRQDKSKPRRKYEQTPTSKKLEIAQWIVDHPEMHIKQVAAKYDLTYVKVWRIINEFIVIKRVMAIKRPTEPADKGSD